MAWEVVRMVNAGATAVRFSSQIPSCLEIAQRDGMC
jgi:hypothetical protein